MAIWVGNRFLGGKILYGMYAISIYDKKTNELYLIRDRAGIKPIYYLLRQHYGLQS